MKKIRLCIGTNDGENIANTHMGDTESFYIYDIFEDSTSKFINKRVNIAIDFEHAREDKMNMIIDLVKDADVFVARQKSPNFVKIASKTKYQPIVVKNDKISEILLLLDRSFDDVYGYIERRKKGEVFNIIPVIEQ